MQSTFVKKEERRRYSRLALAQQLRTLKREGILYTPLPVKLDGFKAKLRAGVLRQCSEQNLTPVQERSLLFLACEVRGLSRTDARDKHLGGETIQGCTDKQNEQARQRMQKWLKKLNIQGA